MEALVVIPFVPVVGLIIAGIIYMTYPDPVVRTARPKHVPTLELPTMYYETVPHDVRTCPTCKSQNKKPLLERMFG